jgi:hypothetical protein
MGYLSGTALGYGLDDWGFESRQRLGNFLFTIASRSALEPTQPPIQGVPGALSLGVNGPGREADRSPPSGAEFKSTWRYNSTPPIHLHSVVLIYAQGQLQVTSAVVALLSICIERTSFVCMYPWQFKVTDKNKYLFSLII